MRRTCVFFVALALAQGIAGQEAIEIADEMYEAEKHLESYDFIKTEIERASSESERAELYWRLARATMEVGDAEERSGASGSALLDRYEEGESYADISIELDPSNYQSYYWKSANSGRWGEVKGVLNSLFKAKPIRRLLRAALALYPEHPASFYVLGILYERVPGGWVSFGNDNYSVSLGRKAVDANATEIEAGLEDEVKLAYHTELARHLWARDWSAAKRRNEQSDKLRRYNQADDILERNFYYEGTIDIDDVSDREEAMTIIRWVIDSFEAIPELTQTQIDDFVEARESYDDWFN